MADFTMYLEDISSNLTNFPIVVRASLTSDSSGHWSLDISNVGLTHVHTVSAQAMSPDNTPANAVKASVSTFSTSTVAGGVHKAANVNILGGSPVQSAGAVTVYVTVIGDQN
jgi:hypothetical protein